MHFIRDRVAQVRILLRELAHLAPTQHAGLRPAHKAVAHLNGRGHQRHPVPLIDQYALPRPLEVGAGEDGAITARHGRQVQFRVLPRRIALRQVAGAQVVGDEVVPFLPLVRRHLDLGRANLGIRVVGPARLFRLALGNAEHRHSQFVVRVVHVLQRRRVRSVPIGIHRAVQIAPAHTACGRHRQRRGNVVLQLELRRIDQRIPRRRQDVERGPLLAHGQVRGRDHLPVVVDGEVEVVEVELAFVPDALAVAGDVSTLQL